MTQKRLSNDHFRIGAEHWEPFFVIEEDEDGSIGSNSGSERYGGVMWELLRFMQRARNFTFTISRPSDVEWGGCDEEGECTGMIGMVSRNEVDFALGTKSILKCIFVCMRLLETRPAWRPDGAKRRDSRNL